MVWTVSDEAKKASWDELTLGAVRGIVEEILDTSRVTTTLEVKHAARAKRYWATQEVVSALVAGLADRGELKWIDEPVAGEFRIYYATGPVYNSGGITREDVVKLVERMILINNNLADPDDIDHLDNRRVKTVGELIDELRSRDG
jgi:DNA-directed RNA polymerase beta subunit